MRRERSNSLILDDNKPKLETFEFKLIVVLSPSFLRSQKHPYERVPTPFQTYSWVAPQLEHSVDSIRAEEGK